MDWLFIPPCIPSLNECWWNPYIGCYLPPHFSSLFPSLPSLLCLFYPCSLAVLHCSLSRWNHPAKPPTQPSLLFTFLFLNQNSGPFHENQGGWVNISSQVDMLRILLNFSSSWGSSMAFLWRCLWVWTPEGLVCFCVPMTQKGLCLQLSYFNYSVIPYPLLACFSLRQ